MIELWESFLSELEKEFGKAAINRWLRSLKIVNYDAKNLYLEAQSAFQVFWFEKEIRKIARKCFLNERGSSIKIHIDAPDLPKRVNQDPKEEKSIYTSTPLSPDCTFATFLVSEETRPLIEFLKGREEGGDAIPLFLFGGTGVGKTHLLMALASHLASKGKKIFFTHAETFTEHVVNAIRSGNVAPLRKTYRCVDVLLLDDVHYLSRKGATQEEFFHTFNSLYNHNCQIILSSHYPPNRLQEIEPRLISRFEWGILFELPTPSSELLEKIVQSRAKTLSLPLSHSTLCELINIFKSSPKAVFRALDALALRHPKPPFTLTLDEIKNSLSDLIAQEKSEAITPEKIAQLVAQYFHIPMEDLLGKSQVKEIAAARQFAVFLCRKELRLPFLKIGKFFNRDHSTIMASIRVIEKKGTDPTVARALFELKEALLFKS